jgi:type VI secretion system secreted protein VgrG
LRAPRPGVRMAAGKVRVTGTGANDFLVRHFSASEGLGLLFTYELNLVTSQRQVKMDDLVGQNWTVTVDLPKGKTRYFNAHVANILSTGPLGRFASYHVTLRPALWFLTLTRDCRIFPNMSVPEIVQELAQKRGVALDAQGLQDTYPTHRYLVQYRETEFNFVSRLMEYEGIYYFFKHEDGKHTVVLSDGPSSHEPAAGYAEVPFHAIGDNSTIDHVDQVLAGRSVQTKRHAINDYDFKKPNAEILVKLAASGGEAEPLDLEDYDYPGAFFDADRGQALLAVRQQESMAKAEVTQISGNVRGLSPGYTFSLTGAIPSELNVEYLVTHATYACSPGDYEATSGGTSDEEFFRCNAVLIRSATQYRPPRVTRRPTINGLHSAKVIGPKGKEIWTDSQGRIRIRFHWQRPEEDAAREEASAIWVRVAQVMAGTGWGALQIPRIGHEVVVSFLEGDPDRPIVTGCVYNDANKPPFNPSAGGMVLGMKSDSTPGGGGYNEFSLDDTKGNERINIHGQFDMVTTIEHDQTLTVHNNRTSTIDVNDTESVGANQDITIGANQSTTITANQTNSIGVNQDSSVGANRSLKVIGNSLEFIGIAKELVIGAGYQIGVGAAMNVTVGGLLAEEIGGAKSVNVGVSSSEVVGGSKSVTSGASLTEKAKDNVTIGAGQKISVSAGDALTITGKKGVIKLVDDLTIKVGSAQITMKKSGDITIKGANIKLDGRSNVVVKGSKIGEN